MTDENVQHLVTGSGPQGRTLSSWILPRAWPVCGLKNVLAIFAVLWVTVLTLAHETKDSAGGASSPSSRPKGAGCWADKYASYKPRARFFFVAPF